MLKKIVSGGQTGADRAALDAARARGFNAGGFCPRRRMAEDGPIPTRYPLTEIDGGYDDRTLKNVIESDATVIFYQTEPMGGTALTAAFCGEQQKPHQLIDIGSNSVTSAGELVSQFIDEESVETLNVAGPRASDCPEIYSFVYAVVMAVLRKNGDERD